MNAHLALEENPIDYFWISEQMERTPVRTSKSPPVS